MTKVEKLQVSCDCLLKDMVRAEKRIAALEAMVEKLTSDNSESIQCRQA